MLLPKGGASSLHKLDPILPEKKKGTAKWMNMRQKPNTTRNY